MPHADQIAHSKRVGAAVNMAAGLGYLTDSNIAAGDTIAGLRTAIDVVKPTLHADQQFYADRLKRALGQTGDITDALVAPLTTKAGLTALTQLGSDTTTRNIID